MIIRITTSDETKGITVAKEDGRVYRVEIEENHNVNADPLVLKIRNLIDGDCIRVNDFTYDNEDNRRIQAKATYNYITSNEKPTDNIERTIEDFIDHYNYELKEIQCTNDRCNSRLGYVAGDYTVVCDNCGTLNKKGSIFSIEERRIMYLEEFNKIVDFDEVTSFVKGREDLKQIENIGLTLDSVDMSKDVVIFEVDDMTKHIILKSDYSFIYSSSVTDIIMKNQFKGNYAKKNNIVYGLIVGETYLKINNELEFEYTDDVPAVMKMLL